VGKGGTLRGGCAEKARARRGATGLWWGTRWGMGYGGMLVGLGDGVRLGAQGKFKKTLWGTNWVV
jgi:hypothetical protein